MKKIKDNYT